MAKPKTKKHKSPHYRDPLGLINKPAKALAETKQSYKRIALVCQGGGALGAYQAGAFRAIHERGYHPNYFAGVSIGAINCAIIAGNPPSKQIDRLTEFWETITPNLWADFMVDYNEYEPAHHLHNQLGALHSVFFGLEGFFKPRPFPPNLFTQSTPDSLSYYDTSHLRNTLERLVDFDRINNKKVTLCLGAVNVASGEMIFFNNQIDTITPDHVLASCALPPGFPAVKIGDDYYWDGGIYANTPFMTVLEALPEENTLCFMIDCFSLKGQIPQTMDQIEERQKDIRYASHSRRLTNVYASRQNLQAAIHYLGTKLSPDAKKDPKVAEVLGLGHEKRMSVVHIIYKATPFAHSFKDYNFIRSAINLRYATGYENAIAVLNKPTWLKKTDKDLSVTIYGVNPEFYEQH